jgi:hypothetical protein
MARVVLQIFRTDSATALVAADGDNEMNEVIEEANTRGPKNRHHQCEVLARDLTTNPEGGTPIFFPLEMDTAE